MIALFFEWFCTLLNCFLWPDYSSFLFSDVCRFLSAGATSSFFFAELYHFGFLFLAFSFYNLIMTTSCSFFRFTWLLLFCVAIIFTTTMIAAATGMIDDISLLPVAIFCCYVC